MKISCSKIGLTSALLLPALLAGCAEQRIRDQAQADIAAGHFDAAVYVLQSGIQQYPESTLLRSGLVQAQTEALTQAVSHANTLRAQGNLNDAQAVLDKALAVDPSNTRLQAVLAEIGVQKHQQAALAEAGHLATGGFKDAALRVIAESLKDNPRNTGLLALQHELKAARRQEQVGSSLATLAEKRGITVDFRDASVRNVLDTVSRASGINFILDKDIRQDTHVTLYLRGARVEDALDLIVNSNQLAKKVIDEKTVLIYPNTPEKQRDYQEQVLRVFYLANADAKGAAAYLKQMLHVHDPYVDERTNMLTVRESADTMELVEHLIALYDSADPEVLLEVEVLEISSTRLTQLGIQFPTSISLTPLAPGTAASLTLGNIKSLTRDNIALGIGDITINLQRQVGDFSTLANPKIRVKNKEKAKVMIGDKIPVVTTTTGTGGFVSDSVNYIDVGVKLEVQPTVYSDDDVAIQLNLEVSTLGAAVKTSSGTLAYQIGTRNATTTLRLHDGETQMLAGLINKTDSTAANRLPGLGDLPIVGRLFSSQTDNGQRTELVLAITPRILRNTRQPPASESELWIGTEAAPKLRPVGGLRASAVDEPSGAASANAGQAVAAATTANHGASQAPTPGEHNEAGQPAPVIDTTVASAGLSWSGPEEVKVGDVFEVTLQVNTMAALSSLPLEVQFEPGSIKLLDATEGDFFKQGGATTSFSKSGEGQGGSLHLGILRSSDAGASGRGGVYKFRFKAVAPGEAFVNVMNVKPRAQSGAPVNVTLPQAQRVLVH